MSRSHSTRKERDRATGHSARHEDPARRDRLATETGRYVDNSTYERPREHREDRDHYYSDSYDHHEREWRRGREHEKKEGRAHSRDPRRSRTPSKSALRRSNGGPALEEGPLRRLSTQPPPRRSSASPGVTPERHRHHRAAAGYDDSRTPEYRRREVEPHPSARRQRPASPPPPRDDSRALVVMDDNHRPETPRRRHPRPRPRESADGIVESPRRTANYRADPSPRRSARGTVNTPRPSKHEPHEEPHRSHSTRRREQESARRSRGKPESGRRSHHENLSSSVPVAVEPQSTGRYVSPPNQHHTRSPRRVHSSRRPRASDEATPHRGSRRHYREEKEGRSSSRHAPRESAHQTPSRTSSRHSRRDVPPPTAQQEEPLQQAKVPPIQPPVNRSGSTVVRPSSQLNSARGQQQPRPSSRRSSSGIEVLGISQQPDFAYSNAAASSARRRYEPLPTPLPVVEIREKISEAKNWLEEMKTKVEKAAEHEERHQSRRQSRNSSATHHPTPSHKRHDDHHEESPNPNGGAGRNAGDRRHTVQPSASGRVFQPPPPHYKRPDADSCPTSTTTATSDEPHLHLQAPPSRKENNARNSVNQHLGTAANSSHRAPDAPNNARPSAKPQQHPGPNTAATNGGTLTKPSPVADSNNAPSTDRQPQASGAAHSSVHRSSVRAPPPKQEKQMQSGLDTVTSTMEEDPIFSFPSFLDGNTFHTTAALCQYNIALAEALTDDQLDAVREAVFNHDEVAFAELLYGDDIQAELALIETTLGHSDDPKVRFEMRHLQSAAVRRFVEKCNAAREKLRSARSCDLEDAVRQAAVNMERPPYGEAVTVPY